MDTANKKERAVTRMESEAAYVPRLVNLHCKLHCTKLTTQDAECANCEETLSNSACTLEQAAKSTIVKATKLDLKVHRTAAKRVFVRHSTTKLPKPTSLLMILTSNKFINMRTPSWTPQSLCQILSLSRISYLPLGNQAAVAPAANLNPYHNAAAAAQNQNVNRHIENTLAHIWRSIRTCFLDAWAAYLCQQKDNDNALRMKKMLTELLTNEATAATAMQIDQETALPPATLDTLIQREVLKATAPLKGTIHGLETQLKNSQRGLPGTSLKPQAPAKEDEDAEEEDAEFQTPVAHLDRMTHKPQNPPTLPTEILKAPTPMPRETDRTTSDRTRPTLATNASTGPEENATSCFCQPIRE
ncbi:unnamed protein product [Cylindrotheca closterium]|uniref:Uncharacterized protein n=1 Tax=Cylindrotheca closterium TaxID=2856 RepID=A0AAD2PV00_9STRA|nr:unnamed protein product [Cylindrotheca closterium]